MAKDVLPEIKPDVCEHCGFTEEAHPIKYCLTFQSPIPANLPEAAAEELIPERTLIRTRGWNHLGQGAAEAIKRHIIAAYREGQQDAESKLAAAQPDGWIAVTERLPEVAKADHCCIPEDEAPVISEPVLVWDEDDCERIVAELEIVDGSAAGAVWRSRETGKKLHCVTMWQPIPAEPLPTPPVQAVQEKP